MRQIEVADGPERRVELGRIAGVLFLAGAAASLPADLLLRDAPAVVFWTDALALVSGLACLAIPWRALTDRSLHAVTAVATAEVTLSAAVAGPHQSVFLWYFLLIAIFAGYVVRRRAALAAHLLLVVGGLCAAAVITRAADPDALVRALVAGPTLVVGAAVVAWLREGLESGQAALQAMADERRAEALTDALTRLPNRRRLLLDLDAALLEDAGEHTLALYDLDGFKAYNDRFGHLAGDALLADLAGGLARAVAAGGAAYRLGGDEFCVLVRGAGDEAAALALAGAGALAAELERSGVGCSVGLARLPADAASTSAALRVADARMYADKARSATARPGRASATAAPGRPAS
ncbi:MAG TPA: GGDEF domain-containing protein [Solirubrobacteraceae bacterium]|jgi:diguanylate cyclase (GGDEF)-like protein